MKMKLTCGNHQSLTVTRSRQENVILLLLIEMKMKYEMMMVILFRTLLLVAPSLTRAALSSCSSESCRPARGARVACGVEEEEKEEIVFLVLLVRISM